jgi:putative heme-binding domain-containing protein
MGRVILVSSLAWALLAQQHGDTPADIEAGARLYAANCVACHGPEGEAIPGVNLRRGQLRRSSSDEELMRTILQGIPGTPMPPGNYAPAELFSLAAYLRTLRDGPGRAAQTGDAVQGRALFEGKGGCTACHRVNGAGSRLGPDLSEVGAIRQTWYLEQSVLQPEKSVLPEHQFVRAVTRGGEVVAGRRLNEDTLTIQLLAGGDRLVSLTKADLREFGAEKRSVMPSYRGRLTASELADLLAYLSSLRGRR